MQSDFIQSYKKAVPVQLICKEDNEDGWARRVTGGSKDSGKNSE